MTSLEGVERRLLLVHGPNLNLLGRREPAIYGAGTLAELEAQVQAAAKARGWDVECHQSNHEGRLLDVLQERAPGSGGVILNAGALTHGSYALYDCLRALEVPIVEVHLSNIHARPEPFRQHSVTAAAAVGVIAGLGRRGYVYAMEYLIDRNE
ncbi:MAG: type II 3-dehydroquinate dehydratase [Candidatus Dormibacteraceae bacterium]